MVQSEVDATRVVRDRRDLLAECDLNLLLLSPGGSGAPNRLSENPRRMFGFLGFVGVRGRVAGRPRVGVFLRASPGLSLFNGETTACVTFSDKAVPEEASRSPPRRRGRIVNFPIGFSSVFGSSPSPVRLPRRLRVGVLVLLADPASPSGKLRGNSPTLRLRRVGVLGREEASTCESSVSWLPLGSHPLGRLRPLDVGLRGGGGIASAVRDVKSSVEGRVGIGERDPDKFRARRVRGGDWETTLLLR